MAVTFAALAIPAGDGVGASTSLAALGPVKNFVLAEVLNGQSFIEFTLNGTDFFTFDKSDGNTSLRQSNFADTRTITRKSQFVVDYDGVVSAARVRRQFAIPGGPVPSVALGAEAVAGNSFGTLNVPNHTGEGVALDSSGFGLVKTFSVGGAMTQGMLIVEGSQDGVTYDTLCAFTPYGAGKVGFTIRGYYFRLRVRRTIVNPLDTVSVLYGEGDDSNSSAAGVASVTGIPGALVDNTDPANPVVSLVASTVVNPVADASALGVSDVAAREDHEHQGVRVVDNVDGSLDVDVTVPSEPVISTIFGPFGLVSSVDIGDTANAGVVGVSARIDHRHEVPPPTVVSNVSGSASALGTSTKPAREDHTHRGVAGLNGMYGQTYVESPMMTQTSDTIILHNANYTTLAEAVPVTGIDAGAYTGFEITLTASRTFAIPSNGHHGEKITFLIRQDGSAEWAITWTGGAGGYRFATVDASPFQQGVTLAAVENLLSIMPPNTSCRVGFEYDATADKWDCVALAGYWT